MSATCGALRQSPEAVSDVVGSILLVGITVVMVAVLGLLIAAFPGPAQLERTDVSLQVAPGSGGWATGDETVRILHRGGDPVDPARSTVAVTISGTTTTVQGAALGPPWADGLTTGETWSRAFTIPQGVPVTVTVIAAGGDAAHVLASNELVAEATTGTSCTGDSQPPTVASWDRSPGVVTGQTTGSVAVAVQLTDDCWGVNQGVTPSLLWRIGTSGPFTDQGAMAPAGSNRWAGTIPAQAWGALVGQTIQYRAGPVADLGGNSATTPEQSFVVQANCSSDNTPPSGALTRSPSDVRTTTTGPVTVTVVASDDCAGVDQATAPRLFYRFNDGTNPAYTDGGTMALGAASTWQAQVPSQTWPLLAGRILEVYVAGMRDPNGNLGTTAVEADLVDIVATYTYVSSNTAATGTVTSFANAQSATDAGAEARASEAGTTGSPVTTLFNSNAVVSSTGWLLPGSTAADDGVHAAFSTSNPTSANDLRLDLQNPVATTGEITKVELKADVSITSANNDGFQVYACLSGGSCSTVSLTGGTSATDTVMSYDVTALRPGGGTWSWTDIANLQATIRLVQSGSRDGTWRVDHVSAHVTAVLSSYTMEVRMGFAGVPAGATHTLEVRHRISADSFAMQVCQDALPTCGTWTTRGPALTSTSAATLSYVLTGAEYNAGAPRIRFIDQNPTGSAQGNLFLDYVRVATV